VNVSIHSRSGQAWLFLAVSMSKRSWQSNSHIRSRSLRSVQVEFKYSSSRQMHSHLGKRLAPPNLHCGCGQDRSKTLPKGYIFTLLMTLRHFWQRSIRSKFSRNVVSQTLLLPYLIALLLPLVTASPTLLYMA